jgi:glyceraldehyde 3-phosphate dehydrogenase
MMPDASTGAAKAISLVLPSLKGKLDGFVDARTSPNWFRQLISLLNSRRKFRLQDDAAMKKAAEGPLKGYLGVAEDPIVSADIVTNHHHASSMQALQGGAGCW